MTQEEETLMKGANDQCECAGEDDQCLGFELNENGRCIHFFYYDGPLCAYDEEVNQ